MQGSFIINIFFLLLLNLFIKPFYVFGIEAHIQDMVGAQAYGGYFALLNFSFMFNIFLDLGIVNYSMIAIAKDSNWLKKSSGTIVSIRLLAIPFYVIFSLVIAYLWKLEIGFVLGLLLLSQVFMAISAYARAVLAGNQFYKTDAIFSMLDKLILILTCLFLFWNYPKVFKIEWLIYAQVFSYGVSAFIVVVFVQLKFGFLKISLERKTMKLALKQTLPFAILYLIMMVTQRMDALFLSKLHINGMEEVGNYAQAFRIHEILNMIPQLFAGLFLPMYAKYYLDEKELSQLLTLIFAMVGSGMIILVVSLLFANQLVMNSIYATYNASYTMSYVWLVLAAIPITFIHIFGSLITSLGFLKQFIFVLLISLLITVLLNLMLVEKYGSGGSAFITFVYTSTTAIGILLIVTFKTKVRIVPIALVKVGLITLICGAYAYFIAKYSNGFALFGTPVLGVILVLFFRLIPFSFVLDIIKSKKN